MPPQKQESRLLHGNRRSNYHNHHRRTERFVVSATTFFGAALIVSSFLAMFSMRHVGQVQVSSPSSSSSESSSIPRTIPSPPSRNKQQPPKSIDSSTCYHMVFSTDCGLYQRWQSYLVFHSALRSNQPGVVTRIASGCTEEESDIETKWHEDHVRPMLDENDKERFRIHLTPKYSSVLTEDGEETGHTYKFFNKPFGLRHWMEHGLEMKDDDKHRENEDCIVILIDPDQIILRPITKDFTNTKTNLLSHEAKQATFPPLPHEKNKSNIGTVQHGRPFGQKYGLGSFNFLPNIPEIVGPSSPAATISKNDARTFYAVGPPYIGTARDMYAISKKWAEFVPKVHEVYSTLLGEMYAYSLAAAHLELRHVMLDSLMVSDTAIGAEGWALNIDSMDERTMCGDIIRAEEGEGNHQVRSVFDLSQEVVFPNVIHHCQRYMLGKWFFGKRRLPHNFFSCDDRDPNHKSRHRYVNATKLMAIPPPDLAILYDYFIPPAPHQPPGEIKTAGTKEVIKRKAFMICAITSALNDAGEAFRRRHCHVQEEDGRKDEILDKTLFLWATPP